MQEDFDLLQPSIDSIYHRVGAREGVEDDLNSERDNCADSCGSDEPQRKLHVAAGGTWQIPDRESRGCDETQSTGKSEVGERAEEKEDSEETDALPDKVHLRR